MSTGIAISTRHSSDYHLEKRVAGSVTSPRKSGLDRKETFRYGCSLEMTAFLTDLFGHPQVHLVGMEGIAYRKGGKKKPLNFAR